MANTVLGHIKNIFPISTQTNDEDTWKVIFESLPETDKTDEARWRLAPWFPTDLFAVTAYLLDASGAFSHFDPYPSNHFETTGYPSFGLCQDSRKKCKEVAASWLKLQEDHEKADQPEEVNKLWQNLVSHATSPLRTNLWNQPCVPEWWISALKLMIIADEVSEDIGGPSRPNEPLFRKSIRAATMPGFETGHLQKLPDPYGADHDAFRAEQSRRSFALVADGNFVNVFPKSRVSVSGCTHRNFSRNLTLLPKVGAVRCNWIFQGQELADDEDDPVDILIIPFPYNIRAKSFAETVDRPYRKDTQDSDTRDSIERNWKNFSLAQDWLKADEVDIVNLSTQLLEEAKKDVASVNGVMLPEYSLDFSTFAKLCFAMKSIEPDLEFIVAGTSTNCEQEIDGKANYVVTAVWHDAGGTSRLVISSRRKHHRWMLSSSQLESYALTSTLDPRKSWWENHNIGQRELHFHPFRKKSLFSAMICEDLARSDPCHEVLRSVAPNLVFVLLMDGPQIPQRWSARYAASLSDDPGCSVLTLTCFGLVDRSNKTRKHSNQEAIAYFSSQFDQTPIHLPYRDGARGVLLTLTSQHDSDQVTIDGRPSHNSRAWKLTSTQPIYPPNQIHPKQSKLSSWKFLPRVNRALSTK